MRSRLVRCDRETGFLRSLCAVTKSYRKNPVSGHLRGIYALRQRNRVFTEFVTCRKVFSKNPVSDHPYECNSKTGKLYRLGTVGVGVRIIWDKQLEWGK